MDDEALIVDVTAELIGERREEWRAGYEGGIRTGTQRALQSNAFEALAVELVVLREAASKLAAQVDYWQRKADEFELAAEHWHGIAARAA